MYKAVMMVTPSHFNVEYIINPYMKDTAGRPNKVNRTAAQKQWEGVKAKFESLGVKVHVIEGQPGLPDMVFSANHGFPFINSKTGKPSILMSQMKNPERRGEIPFVEKWFAQNGYVVEHLSNPKWFFEGNGDAIMHPNQKTVFAGHGHRTDVAVYDDFKTRFGFEVLPVKMLTDNFYHLDTSFSILNNDTVVIQPAAFTEKDYKTLTQGFRNVINVDMQESLKQLAANCFCPNGKDVVVHQGTEKFKSAVTRAGFNVHEVDTSEFLKSGGSVFCMKLALPK